MSGINLSYYHEVWKDAAFAWDAAYDSGDPDRKKAADAAYNEARDKMRQVYREFVKQEEGII